MSLLDRADALVRQEGNEEVSWCLREGTLLAEAAAWSLARLPAAGGSAAAGSTGALLERLLAMAARPSANRGPGDPWAVCRLVLARLFADVDSCRRQEGVAADAFTEGVATLTRPGNAACEGSRVILTCVEGWARLAGIADETGGRPWSAASDEALEAALDLAVRLLGPDRRARDRTGPMGPSEAPWLLDCAARSGSKPLRQAARWLQEPARPRQRVAKHRSKPSPKPPLGRSLDRAGRAALRSGWTADALRVFVDAGGPALRLEVATGDRFLLDGAWDCEILLDGRGLAFTGSWELTAHEAEEAATFLECARPLQEGLRLERQIILLHDDRCLLLADAVVPDSGERPLDPPMPRSLRYRGSLRVGAGLDLSQPPETVEIVVGESRPGKRADRPLMVALPLGIGEWKGADPAGRFNAAVAADGARLEVSQQSDVARMLAAIWLDCDGTRASGAVTWRQLTVADTRQNLPRHRACGYRVRAGLAQWLVYRALDVARNRTVLGCNVSAELLVGRIRKDGSVGRLIEIQ